MNAAKLNRTGWLNLFQLLCIAILLAGHWNLHRQRKQESAHLQEAERLLIWARETTARTDRTREAYDRLLQEAVARHREAGAVLRQAHGVRCEGQL